MTNRGPVPSLRSQWLGEKMRDLRKAAGISQKYAGEYLQRDMSTISRYESGEYPLRRVDLLALLSIYGVSDEKTRTALLQLCDEHWRTNWWDQHRDDFGRDFINLPWLESRADRICSYQHMLMEGLLQTRSYAETVIRFAEEGSASDEQIQRWVELRMDRQQVLDGDDATHLSVILEEYVLDRIIGGPDVWRAQLEQLLAGSARDNVEVRLMPATQAPHAGHLGSFMLFDMPDPFPQVAHLDTHAGGLFVEEPKVHNMRRVWEDLSSRAIDPERSAQLIATRLEE
ncbi:helix-turn-helix transcriptional regulator [Glycomyces scopariae]